ncbi:hypothetical protein [Clostridium beijerinckii]|uniref:hypothetical protein n=1 Tax=Clostridium beijerinckii TaxID=1520 RepID=UPI0017ECD606|nr:hypothetical protein [Clostridium beijerinckii]NOW04336.1 hypothetical protein [Clostridium beijerinckii]NYC02523.1 hypothetical protein [Clostridium beijerinckii]
MIKINEKMKELLKKVEKLEIETEIKADELAKIMFVNFKEVYNCIIIDMNNTIKEESINFQRILSMFGDRTGYEASCNEIRINDYINYSDEGTVIQLGKLILNAWKDKLKTEYPEYNFCIIFSFSNGFGTMRFHVIREDESRWLESDLNKYKDEAIIVEEI